LVLAIDDDVVEPGLLGNFDHLRPEVVRHQDAGRQLA
jgi:hypothetical protein